MEQIKYFEEIIQLLSNDLERDEINEKGKSLKEKVGEDSDWNKIIDSILFMKNNPNFSINLLRNVNENETIYVVSQLLLAIILMREKWEWQDAVAIYDSLLTIDYYKKLQNPDWLKVLVLVNKGIALSKLGEYKKAINTFDSVIEDYSDSKDPFISRQYAYALFSKGLAYGETGEFENEVSMYNLIYDELGKYHEKILTEIVVKALVNKGKRLWFMAQAELDQESRISKINQGIEVLEIVEREFNKFYIISVKEQVLFAKIFLVRFLLSTKTYNDARKRYVSIEEDLEYSNPELRRRVAVEFKKLHQLFMKNGLWTKESEIDEHDLKAKEYTKNHFDSNLRLHLESVFRAINKEKRNKYFLKMDKAKENTNKFITEKSQFSINYSFLLVLREWNSYTPVIPNEKEHDTGGGYFIKYLDQGIIIDPGYDFIDHFYRAGGRMCDIDHIIVTHAHDDHTAQLEALLMLLHRRWNKHGIKDKKVCLYLSSGVQRKFSGLLNLRDQKLGRIITMNPTMSSTENGFEQRIFINSEIELCVLPAYHDDTITERSAVGLGFVFKRDGRPKSRIVFTGDSGLYPIEDRMNEKNSLLNVKKLNVGAGKALYERYPDDFKQPDLFVAHIGSIEKQEFGDHDGTLSTEDEGKWYYQNHLGLLGTLSMLHKIWPKAAIISEFGSELKEFRYELVEKLKTALHESQKADDLWEEKKTTSFVVNGDLTTIYDIINHQFLCHDTCDFVDINEDSLTCRKSIEFSGTFNISENKFVINKKPNSERAYLFSTNSTTKIDTETDDEGNIFKYYSLYYNNKLPIHKKAES